MCFSATASFTASGVLALAGIATLRETKQKSHIPFASIPLLFAVQQFFEGFVWLSLQHADYADWEAFSTTTFLMFAQVVWPIFVPISILCMERENKRRILLIFLSIGGILVGGYLGTCILIYDVKAIINDFHIKYDLFFPPFNLNYNGILYFTATVIPAFVSSVKWMKYFAVAILGSFLLTEVFYPSHLVSVWCFFAAILSSIIYFIMRAQKTT
jgi:hypothetical protein